MLVCYFFPLSSVIDCRCSRGIYSSAPIHSAPLDSLAPLDSSPLRPNPNPNLTPNPSLPLPPFSSPPPIVFWPVPTTANTPLLPYSERTAHRGPELVMLQYTTRPCYASLWRISWYPWSLLPPLPPTMVSNPNSHPPVSSAASRRAVVRPCAGSYSGPLVGNVPDISPKFREVTYISSIFTKKSNVGNIWD